MSALTSPAHLNFGAESSTSLPLPTHCPAGRRAPDDRHVADHRPQSRAWPQDRRSPANSVLLGAPGETSNHRGGDLAGVPTAGRQVERMSGGVVGRVGASATGSSSESAASSPSFDKEAGERDGRRLPRLVPSPPWGRRWPTGPDEGRLSMSFPSSGGFAATFSPFRGEGTEEAFVTRASPLSAVRIASVMCACPLSAVRIASAACASPLSAALRPSSSGCHAFPSPGACPSHCAASQSSDTGASRSA